MSPYAAQAVLHEPSDAASAFLADLRAHERVQALASQTLTVRQLVERGWSSRQVRKSLHAVALARPYGSHGQRWSLAEVVEVELSGSWAPAPEDELFPVERQWRAGAGRPEERPAVPRFATRGPFLRRHARAFATTPLEEARFKDGKPRYHPDTPYLLVKVARGAAGNPERVLSDLMRFFASDGDLNEMGGAALALCVRLGLHVGLNQVLAYSVKSYLDGMVLSDIAAELLSGISVHGNLFSDASEDYDRRLRRFLSLHLAVRVGPNGSDPWPGHVAVVEGPGLLPWQERLHRHAQYLQYKPSVAPLFLRWFEEEKKAGSIPPTAPVPRAFEVAMRRLRAEVENGRDSEGCPVALEHVG